MTSEPLVNELPPQNLSDILSATARPFATDEDLHKYAASLVGIDGLVVEFGVHSGRTINHFAELFPSKTIFGFDSFEGLPEDWRPGYAKGMFRTHGLRPPVFKNVELVVGWFDQTLPGFFPTHPDKVALAHIDCDLYSSTVTVLHNMHAHLVPGSIIIFDEYYNYPDWQLSEYKAFNEYVVRHKRKYEYIGYVPDNQQVAVRITE